MLKLLKYEIIQSYRQYLLTFAIFLIMCTLTPWMPDFISGILLTLLIIAFMGISIAINVNVILNFNRSMYKRPGYLTLTLPVSTNKLVAAKYLGKLKTVTQMISVIFLLLNDFPFSIIHLPIGQISVWIACVISIVSGIDYFMDSKDMLTESM